ncbi:hypothetical protein Micbo1qcDRAFT_203685 [Microdochium bolleyi]|uniref:Short chain dehydrogenase n=1 Tax=Microdochium bolleyi TaxID=196109 RepID=A0A136J3G3_9PEZI|nr:hypothetical protein Micbo1qcDRAFT_203685 [Microdochium bolleyi]
MSQVAPLTALVTGGAGGLGRAIAETFLAAGHNVAVCDVNAERLAALGSEWTASHEGRFLAVKTDITDESAVEGLVASITAKFGRLDFVVNNAGILDKFDPVETTDKATWDRVIGVNLTGTFLVTKHAVGAFLAQQPQPGGTIINIGSVASYRGVNGGLAYTVSKHGVVGVTKNTAGHYGDKGISSIALLLGGMDDTNLVDAFKAPGINMAGVMRIGEVNPGYIQGKTNVALKDVAKYCLFLSDRDIAATANGSSITFNKNWPCA